MNDKDFRSILSLYRSGESATDDARFEEARRAVESDPLLARWWSEEKDFDQIIASKLQSTHVPAGLVARITRPANPQPVKRVHWRRGIALATAAAILLAATFAWRWSLQPASSLADYRDEMVSFVKVDPTLEMESTQLPEVMTWLGKSHAPSEFSLPQKIQGMKPVGCRVLRFRGHNVTLVCFRNEEGHLLHLFVVDRAAFPHLAEKTRAEFSSQGDWATASWNEGGYACLMAVEGDRSLLERVLSDA